ncbi:nitric oxide inducible-like protein [Labeo rohita]|uniref:Nitric oxide synthase n=1 Tax=Labeo rohita TaxID=84645 RepID=A0A498MFG3_LABRO|nr:nitric oxide inducible-like protein [Labeo rohita]
MGKQAQTTTILKDSSTVHTKPAVERSVERPLRCPFAVALRNYKDGSTHQDTLHHKAVKNTPCNSKTCEGSIMNPKTLIRGQPKVKSSSDDILTQAVDFVDQYYNSLKIPNPTEHKARIDRVTLEITLTGSYTLTTDELTFGAKQAWRNAPRCIGRIQWANLQLFDERQCKTAKDMFHALCTHIKYATNGGNMRSAITVFPQRTDGDHDFRVWNGQLIKYAGYQMEDGSVIGDPASVEFTQMCIQLGWKPKYGRFDVLPLVLQANGEDPEVFDVPPELILEVPIEHPEYEWFKDLNLKWYAIPAVANMLLEIGGLEFTACPFNGWYMGTEIGVRDFCDVQRYNVLERVGQLMGLETRKLSSLWKDQALVAINVAVIHSYQKHKVTITDHHSASESFMQHLETEVRLRGGCPADWVWLVPPMSGSLTSVYHQEMLNYILSPFFYYQADAWLTHKWKDEKKGLWRRKVSFRGLMRAVFFSQILIKAVMAKRVRCTVLYATETGKSLTFAKKLNNMLNRAFESRTFRKQLFSLQSLKNTFRYGVFGLGSRVYPQFCAFAHAVDDKLAELGAKRLTATGEGDELNGQDEAFSAWACTAFKDACEAFSIKTQLKAVEQQLDDWDPQRYRVQHDSCTLERVTALSALHSKTVFPMTLKRRQKLQSAQSSRSTILVELKTDGNTDALNFAPGDHVGIFPENSPELVDSILKHLPDAPPLNQSFHLESLSESSQEEKKWQADERIPACTLTQALTYFIDVTTPPSQSLLRKLSKVAGQEEDRKRLEALASDFQEYSTWKDFYRPTFLEVLEEFKSLKVPAAFLLSQLPLMKPRLYSVSSSLDRHPNELHLTLSVVEYHTQDGKGPMHFGTCSTWLNTIKRGHTIPCFVHRSGGFHLPEDPSTPVILIGAGSGIAPFRSFWQQRVHDVKMTGLQISPMTLLFGCRDSQTDHLYKVETLKLRLDGILGNVHTAYSRQPGKQKSVTVSLCCLEQMYVQDVLREHLSEKAIEILHKNAGHLYICGGMNMARDVTSALQDILASKIGMTITEAGEYLERLKSEKRYHEDIFGA